MKPKIWAESLRYMLPYAGLSTLGIYKNSFPRALPWAGLSSALGAGKNLFHTRQPPSNSALIINSTRVEYDLPRRKTL